MQNEKREHQVQDEETILTQEAKRFIRKFPKEQLTPNAHDYLSFMVQMELESENAWYTMHPVKSKLLGLLVYTMEINDGDLEEFRDAIQFQMVVNTQFLIELPEHLRKEPCYQDINKWQHHLLKFINKLIDYNLRIHKNTAA